MTQEYYSIITNSGLAKHAAASLGGSPINLTHLAVGDSSGTSYNPVATATALQNECHRTSVTYVVLDEANPNQLIIEAIIDETVGPFYVREVGVFDADGDLFAIGKFPETFKPNLPSGSGKKLYVRMILAFANSPQVNLVQSENLNYDPNFSTNVFAALAQKLAKAANLSDLTDTAEARANLELVIGANVQAFAENLAAFAVLSGAASKFPYFINPETMGLADVPAASTELQIGLIQIATQSEIDSGINSNKAIVPSALLASRYGKCRRIARLTATNSLYLEQSLSVGKKYLFELNYIVAAQINAGLAFQVSTDNGSFYANSGYRSCGFNDSDTDALSDYNNNSGRIIVSGAFDANADIDIDIGSNHGVCGSVEIFDPSNTGKYKRIAWRTTFKEGNSTDTWYSMGGGAYEGSLLVINKVRFIMKTCSSDTNRGNIASGYIDVWEFE